MVAKIRVKGKIDVRILRKKVKKANIENMFKAGAAVRTTMRRSLRKHKKKLIEKEVDGKIRKVREPSPVGTPPRTTGAMRNAIKFEVSKQKDNVIVGPDGGEVANVGKAHEFGGRYRGRTYQKRPFARPALLKIQNRLPKLWANSIKG